MIFNRLEKSVAGGAIIIALFSILSRLVGLLRDRLLSSHFGAGPILDAYYAAFRLPDLVFNTLVLGALASAFVPVFLEYWTKNKDEAWRINNSVLNILFSFILLLAIIIFIFAPYLIDLMVPGFTAELKILTVRLTRVMLLGILFFTLSNVTSSSLTALRRFSVYGAAPLMYNLGIIFGILVLVEKTSLGPIGLGWGVVLGSALHFLVQIPALIQAGWRWRPIFTITHPAVKKICLLMMPRCFGLAIGQLNIIVTTAIASTLISGAIAVYNLAFNLVSFPINIFGVSLAISVFPILSQSFVDGNKTWFVHQSSKTMMRVLYLIIPTTVLFILLRTQIVRLILGAGKFDWHATILTAQSLGWFSLALFSESLIPVLARAFYASQNTKTPVKTALVGFIFNIVGCLILGRLMGTSGLALAFSIASIINFSLLCFYFCRKNGGFVNKNMVYSFLKIILVSLLMAGLIQIIKYLIAPLVNMQTFVGILTQTSTALIGGLLFYFIMSLVLKIEEVNILREVLIKKIGKIIR